MMRDDYKKGGKSKRDPRLKRAGVSGFNEPKRTPNHPKKSHVVVAAYSLLDIESIAFFGK